MKMNRVRLYLAVALLPFANAEAKTNTSGLPGGSRFRATTVLDVAQVDISRTCIESGGNITIDFTVMQQPQKDDWVGIYPDDYHATEEPVYWVSSRGWSGSHYESSEAS